MQEHDCHSDIPASQSLNPFKGREAGTSILEMDKHVSYKRKEAEVYKEKTFLFVYRNKR